MPPFLGGGHMISRVTLEGSRWAEPPARFEAGTSAIAEGVGLGAACDFVAGIGADAIAAHDADLVRYMDERLASVDGLTVYGPADRAGITSFALDWAHPHDVAEILGREGVCVRAGHHCAQPLMRRFGVSATSRASFSVHSTREDVDRLVDGLESVHKIFG
jgi:cysteine desulfurase/selenocysteine lyase